MLCDILQQWLVYIHSDIRKIYALTATEECFTSNIICSISSYPSGTICYNKTKKRDTLLLGDEFDFPFFFNLFFGFRNSKFSVCLNKFYVPPNSAMSFFFQTVAGLLRGSIVENKQSSTNCCQNHYCHHHQQESHVRRISLQRSNSIISLNDTDRTVHEDWHFDYIDE